VGRVAMALMMAGGALLGGAGGARAVAPPRAGVGVGAACAPVDASTLISYGATVVGPAGTFEVFPAGARLFFRLSPRGVAGAGQYGGYLRVARRAARTLDLVADNPVEVSDGGVGANGATLPLRVRVDAGRGSLAATATVGRARLALAGPIVDAPGLAALACALPLARARRWDALYGEMAPAYRQRFGRDALAAALGSQAPMLVATRPPAWEVGLRGAGDAARFWGGDALVAEFFAPRGAGGAPVAVYAVRVAGRWDLVVAPPLACSLVAAKGGPFTCAIGLATSDALGSYHLKVDGYGTVDGGLFAGQFSVVGATMPWELDPGPHTAQLSSDTQGSDAPTVGTAPITIPGAPTTPCLPPTSAPAPPSAGAALRIPGAFPDGVVHVTVDTRAITDTWDGFEIDVDGAINGSDPGAVTASVGIQVPHLAAPGWHVVSIYRLSRPGGSGPWVRGALYAQAPFLVYAPGDCVLPANSTPSH